MDFSLNYSITTVSFNKIPTKISMKDKKRISKSQVRYTGKMDKIIFQEKMRIVGEEGEAAISIPGIKPL